METVKVRNIEIGSGIPKICVPIVGRTQEDILNAAAEIRESAADLAEWRADWFEGGLDPAETEEMLKKLRSTLGEVPLLYTFRTAKEGGEKEISADIYVKLLKSAVQSGYADLVDVELFTGEAAVSAVIKAAHDCGVKVIVSNHDFQKTPEKAEILFRLITMQKLGADVPKIAVTPQDRKDVLTLLAASEEMLSEHADRPVITISMGGLGAVSRMCGEMFGSAITFGAIGQTSAPGQMEAGELKAVLAALHKSLTYV